MAVIFRNLHISFADYATLNFRYLIKKQKLRLLLSPLLILIVIFANVYSYSADGRAPSETAAGWEAIGLAVAGMVVAFILVVFLTRRGWRRRYDKTQFLQSPATYTFTDQGISIDSPTSQGSATWESIDRLFLVKELALLTTRNFTVYFLDFRYLEAPTTKADFLALLQKHAIPGS